MHRNIANTTRAGSKDLRRKRIFRAPLQSLFSWQPVQRPEGATGSQPKTSPAGTTESSPGRSPGNWISAQKTVPSGTTENAQTQTMHQTGLPLFKLCVNLTRKSGRNVTLLLESR